MEISDLAKFRHNWVMSRTASCRIVATTMGGMVFCHRWYLWYIFFGFVLLELLRKHSPERNSDDETSVIETHLWLVLPSWAIDTSAEMSN